MEINTSESCDSSVEPTNPPKKGSSNKAGKIYCVCSFHSWENGMIVCVICESYSHADCYGITDISIQHVCGPCFAKTNRPCSNAEIGRFVKKPNKTRKEHSSFAFNLMVRRTLTSIVKEEYKSSQPGLEPGEIFLQLRFGMSTSYSSKVLFFLVKQGFVNFYNGFSADEDRIVSFLHGPSNDPGFLTSETEISLGPDGSSNANPVVLNLDCTIGVTKKSGPRTQNISQGFENSSPDPLVHQANSVCDSGSLPSPFGSSSRAATPESTYVSGEVFEDSFSGKFQKHFLWPTRFLDRETRKENEPLEPMEVWEVGKNSRRPFYGQILETAGPRLNSQTLVGWNLVFTVGRSGESVQVWSFGTETEIGHLSELIQPDSYMVFWQYSVSAKTSNKLKATSDWCVKIPPSTTKFGVVRVTRKYIRPEDANGENLEKFSEKFKPSPPTKAVQKKKEHRFEEKQLMKTDRSQPKIDSFLKDVDLKLDSSNHFDSDEYNSRKGSDNSA